MGWRKSSIALTTQEIACLKELFAAGDLDERSPLLIMVSIDWFAPGTSTTK